MNTYKEKLKIAVVAPPFSGHLYPILELVLPLLNKKDKLEGAELKMFRFFQKF